MERKKRKWELAEQKGWTVPLVMAQTKKEKKKKPEQNNWDNIFQFFQP